MDKTKISNLFFCKCKLCIYCKKESTKTYLKKYEYELFINQNLDHIIINNYFICLLCCEKTNYNTYNKVIKPHKNNNIMKQHSKYRNKTHERDRK